MASDTYDQLISEYGGKFKAEAAQYAIDNVKADWNANALAKAKDYQKQPDSLTVVKEDIVSIGIKTVYAADPDGNVWHATVLGDNWSEWKLFKRKNELDYVQPSFEQMIAKGKAQQAKDGKI